jgi:uncharacterized membrane protein (UPF0127 family)
MKRMLLLVLVLFASAAGAQALPVMDLTAGFHRIEVEVAATGPARMQGLMHRKAMPQQRGMLFVFPAAATQCFWMKNTLIPLSIAFLDETGRIVQIADMRPRSEDNHCSVAPVRFALEMNAGWFASRGLKAGDSIGGIERAPRGQ